MRSTDATQKRDSKVRSRGVTQKRDSKVRSRGATHKRDRQVRLTSVIDRCDSQVRSIESRIQKFASLQVCKFASLKKLESSQVRKFALIKNKKIQKTLLNESGQFDNECSTINWCLRVVGTLRLLI